jgi:hypothetical protein
MSRSQAPPQPKTCHTALSFESDPDSPCVKSISAPHRQWSAAASRGASFSPLHWDFLGHHEDAVG